MLTSVAADGASRHTPGSRQLRCSADVGRPLPAAIRPAGAPVALRQHHGPPRAQRALHLCARVARRRRLLLRRAALRVLLRHRHLVADRAHEELAAAHGAHLRGGRAARRAAGGVSYRSRQCETGPMGSHHPAANCTHAAARRACFRQASGPHGPAVQRFACQACAHGSKRSRARVRSSPHLLQVGVGLDGSRVEGLVQRVQRVLQRQVLRLHLQRLLAQRVRGCAAGRGSGQGGGSVWGCKSAILRLHLQRLLAQRVRGCACSRARRRPGRRIEGRRRAPACQPVCTAGGWHVLEASSSRRRVEARLTRDDGVRVQLRGVLRRGRQVLVLRQPPAGGQEGEVAGGDAGGSDAGGTAHASRVQARRSRRDLSGGRRERACPAARCWPPGRG